MKAKITILSEQVNCPVVQMAGRRFPGVVLQGDSLRVLLDAAEEIRELCSAGGTPELVAAASSLEEKLAGYISHYEQVMMAAGRELPYPARSK